MEAEDLEEAQDNPAPAAPQQSAMQTQSVQPVPAQPAAPTRAPSRAPDPPREDNLDAPITMLAPQGVEQPAGKSLKFNDYAETMLQRYLGMGQSVLGAASDATRAVHANGVTEWIEQQKKGVANAIQNSLEEMSPQAQRAAHSSMLGYLGAKDENGDPMPTPGEAGWSKYLAINATAFLPDLALMLLTHKLGASTATSIASKVGAGETAMKTAGTLGGAAATGGIYGILGVGDSYNQLISYLDSGKHDDELAQTPAGKEALAQGMSIHDYKKTMVDKLALPMAAMSFGLNAAAGAGATQLLMKGPLATQGKAFLARLGLSMGEGATLMGGQGAGDTAIQQNATNQMGVTNGFDAGKIAKAFASGALGGAALGAFGALRGGRGVESPQPNAGEQPGTQTPGPSTAVADPAVGAALDTQLSMPFQAPPGINPGDAQGQLFRGMGEANANTPGNAPGPDSRPAGGGPGPGGTSVQPGSAPTDLGAVAAQPTIPGTVSVGPTRSGPRPSDGLKRADLIDAIQVATGADSKTLNRMTVGDLRDRFDRAHPATEPDTSSGRSNVTTSPDTMDAVGQLRAENQPAPTTVGETPSAPTQPEAGHPAAIEAAQASDATHVDQAAAQAEIPTPAQADAGNYQKGHTKIGGLDVSIETPKGGVRKGVGPSGEPWEATMPGHYGYIKKTTGADGDHVDVTLGPKAHQAEDHQVYVIDQKDPATGKFDEHKAMIGFENPLEAIHTYDASFSDGSGPTRRGAVNNMSFDEFKKWTGEGDTTKAVSYKPTVSDQLRAKRAAQKAAMAKPGERMKGAGVTSEGAEPTRTSGTGKSEPRTLEEATNVVRATVEKYKIVPLQKGADIERAISQVARELQGRLKDARTEGDVAEAVAKWARSDANPLPGTRTRRMDIGDQVMRLLTNKTVDQFSGRSDRVGAEAARASRQPALYESEGAARKAELEALGSRDQDVENDTSTTSGETPAKGEAQPATQAFEGKEPALPQKVSDRLPFWLDRIRQGTMTPTEAAEMYARTGSVAGRPREFKTFGDYLDAKIRAAEDPATKAKLLHDLAAEQKREMANESKGEFAQEDSAETKRIDKALAETGKEAADKLREMKAELDPTKAAADAVTPERAIDKLRRQQAERAAVKQPPTLGRIATVVHDPRVNRVVNDMLDSGKPHTLHDYLRAIGKDELVNTEAPELASLARRMLSLARDDIPVGGTTGRGLSGAFDPGLEPGTGAINVDRRQAASSVETMLHEGMHSITAHYIENLPASHPDRLALDAMHAELTRALDVNRRTMSAEDVKEVEYALTDAHELHTMLMTNPATQRLATASKPSFGFQGRMRALGYGLDTVKSVWAAFTNLVRRSLGLKGPMNGRDATLMDHVLKPITDITERAAAFNRTPPVRDWTLGADGVFHPTSELGSAVSRALPSFKDTKDDLMSHLWDSKTLGDKGTRALLGGATTDSIVRFNEKRFDSPDGNSLHAYRTAFEAIEAAKKTFNDQYADRVAKWATDLKGPERDKVASLIVDASTADVKLGKGMSNSPLQARYDALTPSGKASYDESHAIHDAMYAREREAHLDMMLKGTMPDATPAQLAEIRKAATSKTSMDAFLSDPDHSSIAAKFGAEWGSVNRLVKGIAEVHKAGFIEGDYFPLNHDGDYILHYGEKGEAGYGMEAFTTVGAAEARRTQLAAQGVDGLSPVMSKRENFNARDAISVPAIDEVVAAMKRNGMDAAHIEEMHNLMASVAMQNVMHGAGTRARLRRQGVLGASTKVEQIAAQSMTATGARVANMEHGIERAQALQAMQNHTDSLGAQDKGADQRVAQAVTNEMQKRVPKGDYSDNVVTKTLGKANAFGYVQSLQSFSHMITSTMEAHTNSIPLLGSRHGAIQASVALGKALKDATPVVGTGVKNMMAAFGRGLKAADWNLSTLVRDRMVANGADRGQMIKLFDSLNKSGLIDHTFIREIRQIANPGFLAKKMGWWGRFMDFNAAGSHAVDVANKSAIAKAAFDLEFRKTGNVDASVKYATDMARSAMPNYNAANKARISTAQGPLGRLAAPITQFKQYGIHQYSMMAALAHEAMKGETPAGRSEARKAFAGILATHALTAGIISGTFLGDGIRFGGGLYDWLSGDTKTRDHEADVRSVIASVFGPEVGELISRGLPHAVGIDVHRRIGLSNLLEPPELKSFDQKGVGEAVAQAMLGASGEDAATLAGGLSKIIQGDLDGGLKAGLPRFFRDILKAYDLGTKGLTDSTGKTILPAEKISGWDVARQAVGFQPSRVTEFREGRSAIMDRRDEGQQAHNQLTRQWIHAAPEDRADIMQHILRFNQVHPEAKITVGAMIQQAKKERKTASEANAASFGLALSKKQRGLSEAGSFANVR